MITFQCNAGPNGSSEILVNDPNGDPVGPPVFDPATFIFDPALAPIPGVYSVILNCINDCGTHTDIQTFTITEGVSWHQTTKWSENREIINDVITDSDGNVFVTGNKMGPTFLNGGISPDISLNGIAPSNTAGAFVAKYDRCGNLIWGADIYGEDLLTSNAIVVDGTNNIVYITGNINRNCSPTDTSSKVERVPADRPNDKSNEYTGLGEYEFSHFTEWGISARLRGGYTD